MDNGGTLGDDDDGDACERWASMKAMVSEMLHLVRLIACHRQQVRVILNIESGASLQSC